MASEEQQALRFRWKGSGWGQTKKDLKKSELSPTLGGTARGSHSGAGVLVQ